MHVSSNSPLFPNPRAFSTKYVVLPNRPYIRTTVEMKPGGVLLKTHISALQGGHLFIANNTTLLNS